MHVAMWNLNNEWLTACIWTLILKLRSQSNPKQLWKVIGQLTGGQNRVDIPHDLIANYFNNYFSKIGMKTVEHLRK